MKVKLPNDFTPRKHQVPFWRYFASGGKRYVLLAHRRMGKDLNMMHLAAVKSTQRVGNYIHMLPSYSQARRVIWDAIDGQGRRIIDTVFPPEIRMDTRNNDMFIRFLWGSTWQLQGSDTYNAIMGTNPVGISYSEYSLSDPMAWEYLAPILHENGGWACFAYTPRGRGAGYNLYQHAVNSPGQWGTSYLTVKETGMEHLAIQAKEDGVSDELIAQEYYLSFDAPNSGSVFGAVMSKARREGRLRGNLYDPSLAVYTAWDLGFTDATAIWFYQKVGKFIHVIDYYENFGERCEFYLEILRKRGYMYGNAILPHDAKHKDWTTGRLRTELFNERGMPNRVLEPIDLGLQVELGRSLVGRCIFDEEKCQRGILCLESYHYPWNDKNRAFGKHPVHDWSSHGSSAFMSMAANEVREDEKSYFGKSEAHYGTRQGAFGFQRNPMRLR